MHRRMNRQQGFTLVELVVAIMIAAVLTAVLMRSAGQVSDAANFSQTEAELDALAIAVAGNPSLENGGMRSDFGYVGDIGALPASLDNLVSNPGGYATWKGPYISNRFTQATDDYRTDSWGAAYTWQPDSARIISNGSGSPLTRQIEASKSDLLMNQFRGTVLDADRTAPGPIYRDSVTVRLTVPNGTGGTVTKTRTPDLGGSFVFDSLPIGNHSLQVIYKPTADTMTRTVAIEPGTSEYAEYNFHADYWRQSSGEGLAMVPESDTLYTSCTKLRFYIRNSTGRSISVSSIQLYYPGTTAYWTDAFWNGTQVVNLGTGIAGGSSATFSSAQAIGDGQKVKIEIERFRTGPSSGGWVDISDVAFTVLFSDGSRIRFTGDVCP